MIKVVIIVCLSGFLSCSIIVPFFTPFEVLSTDFLLGRHENCSSGLLVGLQVCSPKVDLISRRFVALCNILLHNESDKKLFLI